jgi:Rab3 GTPase-activating protein catalytic subunit
MMSLGGALKEFPASNSHPIHYFYGLNNFLVLNPNVPNEKEDIDNETRSKMALSTITVALNNTGCSVPCFVQVMDRFKDMFIGVATGGGFRTNYEMIVLNKRPPYCDHLTGLLNMFKSKIKQDCASDLEIPSVKVSARFSYILDDWTCHVWSQTPPDLDMFSGVFGPDLVQDLSQLPFGTLKDPVKQLKLHASWYDLPEDIITDNDVHSDLDLVEAPAWAVGVQFEDLPQPLLTEYLRLFNSICDQNATLRQLLGEDMFKEDAPENLDKIPDVFNRLTGSASGYSLTSLINPVARWSRSAVIGGPIKADHLIKVLDYLFPDAQDHPKYPYPKNLGRFSSQHGIAIKSSPIDGLVWRLAIVFAHCLHVLGGIKPLAHLMHEVMLEIRFRWESGQVLPGLPSGSPDHGFCLFHQKLQMINCCIDRKLAREKSCSSTAGEADQQEAAEEAPTHKDNDSETDEDEFYDCDDDHQVQDQSDVQVPVWSKEPIGRLKRLGKTKLLHQDDFLYVPMCQDPSPLTEDMLAEQAEVMLQLGMDAEGARLRAKMQSASLLSDMESFKAANPGAVLGDFVRWHSPRDWDQEKVNNSAFVLYTCSNFTNFIPFFRGN